jgi:hypothetical protein
MGTVADDAADGAMASTDVDGGQGTTTQDRRVCRNVREEGIAKGSVCR